MEINSAVAEGMSLADMFHSSTQPCGCLAMCEVETTCGGRDQSMNIVWGIGC